MATYEQGKAAAAQFDEYNRKIWEFDSYTAGLTGRPARIEVADGDYELRGRLEAAGAILVEA